MRHKVTKEEKVATKLSELVNDITLNLNMVGFYLGRFENYALYERLQAVAFEAQQQRELMEQEYTNPHLEIYP